MIFPRTPRSLLRALLIAGLIAFFAVGGVANLFPPASVRADYARWGYPDGFHYLTGSIELTAALLLLPLRTRDLGRVLAALVMLGAIATLVANGEWTHAIAPVTLISALALSRYMDEKAREYRWEGKVF